LLPSEPEISLGLEEDRLIDGRFSSLVYLGLDLRIVLFDRGPPPFLKVRKVPNSTTGLERS